ncbi:unnamed protein product [Microthlaspi erraticum]|uniref:Reverse transcriptase Ty1/copia-type domain-containing protein n=1 Tax=Microthlaspi erraticum TaxID=1685480 RepID=A0A6D2I1B3_9BRAS|nr:unnamed protein product [Microthlaspi erraticum]
MAENPENPAAVERAFGVTNIKSHIPLILDFDDHNYDAWRELFLTHCLAFDVLGHLDGTLLPNGDNDVPWKKRDGLVKLWLYGTLTPPLFRSSFATGGMARDIWTRIENQFRNNKEARAIQLDNELRTTEIGDQTIQQYCQTLKSLSDRLANVEAPVTERNLVMYLLNGLNEKYDYITNVIKHKEPFPSFESAKSMLEMEESRLKKAHRPAATHTDHSSSSTALSVSAPQSQMNDQSPRHTQPHQKFNNYRGKGKNNYRGRGRNNYQYQSRPSFPYWAPQNNWPGPFPPWPNQFPHWNPYSPMPMYRGSAPYPMTPSAPQANLVEIKPTELPQAHTTSTLFDPSGAGADWYMDTGATAHLSASADSAYSFLNSSDESSPLFKSILQTPLLPSPTNTIPNPSPSLPNPEIQPQSQAPQAQPHHTMTTRSKAGIRKPQKVLSLLAKTKSPLPKSYIQALSDPNWTHSMTDEYDAMIKTKSWNLVPRPPNVNIVRSMWLYTHKHDADGALTRHKSRLVANGKSQEAGVDFTETFSHKTGNDTYGPEHRRCS